MTYRPPDTQDDIHVIVDIDGIILDWSSAFRNYMQDCHGIVMRMPVENIRAFSFHDYMGIDKGAIFGHVQEFSRSPSFAHIQPYPGAVSFLRAIDVAGLKIHAVTACGEDDAAAHRRQNLATYAGWRQEWPIHALPLGASKLETFRTHFPADRSVLLDDLHKNIVAAREAGLHGLWHKSQPGTLYHDCGEHLLDEAPSHSWPEASQRLRAFVAAICPDRAQALDLALANVHSHTAPIRHGTAATP